MASPTDTVTHIVLFQIKDQASASQRQAIWDGFYSLKTRCLNADGKPYIKSIVGGKDHSAEGLQAGITHAFVVEFETLADRDYYVNKDQVHAAFVSNHGPHFEKAQVIDFTPSRF